MKTLANTTIISNHSSKRGEKKEQREREREREREDNSSSELEKPKPNEEKQMVPSKFRISFL
jgi:hypothetical protein